MRTLWDVWENPKDPDYSKLQSLISLQELQPSDVMDLDPVRRLINPELIQILNRRTEPKLNALGQYLNHLHQWYQSFRNHDLSIENKVDTLKKCYLYFESLKGVTDVFKRQTKETYESLQLFAEFMKKAEIQFTKTSYLGTDVVENFFSIIRQKVRYPTLFDYWYTQERAWNQLIQKHNAKPDYRLPQKSFSKNCYNLLPQDCFTPDQLPSNKVKERKVECILKPKPSADSIIKMKLLVAKYKPTRKRMLFQESTCKENPTQIKVKKGYHHCRHGDCVKTYTYRNSYIKHVQKHHNLPNFSVDDAEKEFTRADCQLIESKEPTFLVDELGGFVSGEPLSNDSYYLFTRNQLCPKYPQILWTDIETNNSTDREIIEILVANPIEDFYTKVKPKHPIDPNSKHSIDSSMLEDKPNWETVGIQLLEYTKRISLLKPNEPIIFIAHNGPSFDFNIIQRQMKEINLTLPQITWIDSINIIKSWLPNLNSYGLGELCSHFAIHQFNHHSAVDDVKSTMEVVSQAAKFHFKDPDVDVEEKIMEFCKLSNQKHKSLQISPETAHWNDEKTNLLLSLVAEGEKIDWKYVASQIGFSTKQCQSKLSSLRKKGKKQKSNPSSEIILKIS
eukprot:TRINITY_DN6516_c0_g2_i1.p1 TRINITY_DN6516_c0_g2~~TRINITY_DN6516_c0_g2_i1.p1  ORF type:complete len:618 (+),score=92.84 TRINITY_DN6516_c0_g2_i1:603-2456(+)